MTAKELKKTERKILLALFPAEKLSTNKLVEKVEAHYDTARKHAQPLIKEDLVREEEIVKKGNFIRQYSLTDKGRKLTYQVTKTHIKALKEEMREIEQLKSKYEEKYIDEQKADAP